MCPNKSSLNGQLGISVFTIVRIANNSRQSALGEVTGQKSVDVGPIPVSRSRKRYVVAIPELMTGLTVVELEEESTSAHDGQAQHNTQAKSTNTTLTQATANYEEVSIVRLILQWFWMTLFSLSVISVLVLPSFRLRKQLAIASLLFVRAMLHASSVFLMIRTINHIRQPNLGIARLVGALAAQHMYTGAIIWLVAIIATLIFLPEATRKVPKLVAQPASQPRRQSALLIARILMTSSNIPMLGSRKGWRLSFQVPLAHSGSPIFVERSGGGATVISLSFRAPKSKGLHPHGTMSKDPLLLGPGAYLLSNEPNLSLSVTDVFLFHSANSGNHGPHGIGVHGVKGLDAFSLALLKLAGAASNAPLDIAEPAGRFSRPSESLIVLAETLEGDYGAYRRRLLNHAASIVQLFGGIRKDLERLTGGGN